MVRLVKWLSHEFVVLVSWVQFPYLTPLYKSEQLNARFCVSIGKKLSLPQIYH